MAAHIVVRDLRKSYAGIEAVRGVSFSVEPGEIFGLLGPNGAGKTTTVECLIGLREPDSGELEVCGLDARKHPREVKQKVGVALQSTALQDKITPREALRMFGSFYRERVPVEALIERFALSEKADARFETLSGGQRQRLALALAFVNRPQLVFLDEPTTGLDPQSRRELHAAILQMKREGYTVLFTTHYLDEAEQLCDRVAIIDHGRIVASGTPRELIGQSKGKQWVTLLTHRPIPPGRLARLAAVEQVTEAGGGSAECHFQTANATATLAALTQLLEAEQLEVVALSVRKASLEEVFLQLTRAAGEETGSTGREDKTSDAAAGGGPKHG